MNKTKILLVGLVVFAVAAVLLIAPQSKEVEAYSIISEDLDNSNPEEYTCSVGRCACAFQNGQPTECCQCSCGGGSCIGHDTECSPPDPIPPNFEDISWGGLKRFYA